MKILYAIQGTGNGHLSRARDIIPLLECKGELDILISGTQADIELPYPVKYRFTGLSFIFGKKGGIDLMATYKKSNLRKLLSEINSLPVEAYDVVISDFEPVSSWACYIRGKSCIGLSHQSAVLNKSAPSPKHTDQLGKALLNYYAPFTACYGFHFKSYGKNIFTPVIRKQVRELTPENKGHYTVYLPAYGDKRIIEVLTQCKGTRWQVFSKHNKKFVIDHNVSVYPISNDSFINSMAGAEGIICGAGFETPAEAMYLGKKLMVIPMKNQYEQSCNAAALASMGVPVLKSLKKKHLDKIKTWIRNGTAVPVNYPDITSGIIDEIVNNHAGETNRVHPLPLPPAGFSLKGLKKLTIEKILAYMAT